MLFPDNANAKYQWNEPWFFKLRASTKTAWVLRAGFFIGVYVLFAVLMSMDSKSAGGPQFGTVEILILPTMIAGLFLAMIELPNIQRVVTLTDNDISCIGTLMMFGGPISLLTGTGQWNRREIKTVQLLRTGEPGNDYSFGLMIITPKHAKEKQLAIPLTVSLSDVANHLHTVGIDVRLSDWQHSSSDLPEPETENAK
ncbi:MAG: hypothetical protein HUJ26_23705 [Planctomycetaceae bacterium]|nr:hypothetical protein [Planctomycetaceae bacterium]